MMDARLDGANALVDTTDAKFAADHSEGSVIPLFQEELSVSKTSRSDEPGAGLSSHAQS